eukprot:SAG25_NODE_136_length_14215_cov_15.693114_6_plen_90_part_00
MGGSTTLCMYAGVATTAGLDAAALASLDSLAELEGDDTLAVDAATAGAVAPVFSAASLAISARRSCSRWRCSCRAMLASRSSFSLSSSS